MRFRSIRWTLLFWYAVVLVGSLAALGWALHRELDRTLYRDADAQLEFWMATARHKVEEYPAAEWTAKLESALPPDATFAVWNTEGRVVASSPDVRDRAVPEGAETLTWGHVRAQTRPASAGGWVLVGKSVRVEHDRTRQFLDVLLLASAVIVVVAVGGGWVLVSRALRPVDRIASTAHRISGENLGERIETANIQNELGGLARTLNESFDRLEAAFERQTRFTADASHELRTPLAIIRSHLELAEREDRTKEQLLERIGICRDAALRMQSVVEGLLTLARADAGELQIAREEVDLVDLLDEVRESMAPLAARRGITIEHRLEPATVRGDRERLCDVATNLYSNAVHYNREGGDVVVSLAREGGDAVLRVTDTGLGITEEDQSKIFERFVRVDKARSRAEGGSGLGLSIVRWIVELHGGSVSVTSRPGAGSEFIVRIPARPISLADEALLQ